MPSLLRSLWLLSLFVYVLSAAHAARAITINATLTPAQVDAWFNAFIAPFETSDYIDAYAFAYFSVNAAGQTHIQTQVRGRCYSLQGDDVGAPDAATSLFRIGSVQKVFTAVSLMQLWERGLVKLDDPIALHVPEVAERLKGINMTVLDTLRHTIGMDERILNIYIPGTAGIVESLGDGMRAMWTTQLVAPGSRVTYANLGVTIMGAVIENVSGLTLAEYYAKNLVQPLALSGGMRMHTDMNGDFSSVCYSRAAVGVEPVQIRTTPSGDAYMTVVDVAKVFAALLNGGQGIFQSPATFELMQTRLYPETFDALAYILYRETFGDRTLLWKDGGTFTFSSFIGLLPESGEGLFAAASNGPKPSPTFIAADMVYRFLVDNNLTSAQPVYPYPVQASCDTARMNAIAGQYFGSRGGQKSPVKVAYLFGAEYFWIEGCEVHTYPYTYTIADVTPPLPANQMLLQANTSNTPHGGQNYFLLVTFSTPADGGAPVTVLQIEEFPSLSTAQPMIWSNSLITVLALTMFVILNVLIAAIGLPIRWLVVRCRYTDMMSVWHHASLLVAVIDWFLIFFIIALATQPTPNVYYGLHPGFAAIQVLFIMQFIVVGILALGSVGITVARWRGMDAFAVADPEKAPINTSSGRAVVFHSPIEHTILILFCVLFLFDIIGIPGIWALNMVTFTLW